MNAGSVNYRVRVHTQFKAVSADGFTLVEMVTMIVIAGVLAAFAAPRFFDRSAFDSRGFYDQLKSTLRYAQKAAIAQNRFVCVDVGSNIVTLSYDPAAPGAAHAVADCSGNLPLTSPTGQSPYSTSSHSVSFTGGAPVQFYFDPLGRPSAAQNFTINGYAISVSVEADTGYVH
ncbi:MAG: GspH/FimT family pseudopilin [Pseudomonadota bacterium]